MKKSLYGLKQANRQWFAKLSSHLKASSFSQSAYDHSLFVKIFETNIIVLLAYVDDIILAGNHLSDIEQITQSLDDTFKVKNLGNLKYFLGLEIARSSEGIHVSQRKYALDILADSGLLASKACATLITKDTKGLFEGGVPLKDITPYQRLIGRLLYLTNTRPDIGYVAQFLSQFIQSPTKEHLATANRVLRYIKAAPGQGLFFPSNSTLQIKGFCDSDWATCPNTHRSTIGLCVFLGSSLKSWKSKKQSTISRSSSKVEYRAFATLTCDIQWLKYLFDELQIKLKESVVVYCDNQSTRHIALNPISHERTKHIEIDCYVVREKVQDKLYQFLPITSTHQAVDVFTKALDPGIFKSVVSKLGLLDIHS